MARPTPWPRTLPHRCCATRGPGGAAATPRRAGGHGAQVDPEVQSSGCDDPNDRGCGATIRPGRRGVRRRPGHLVPAPTRSHRGGCPGDPARVRADRPVTDRRPARRRRLVPLPGASGGRGPWLPEPGVLLRLRHRHPGGAAPAGLRAAPGGPRPAGHRLPAGPADRDDAGRDAVGRGHRPAGASPRRSSGGPDRRGHRRGVPQHVDQRRHAAHRDRLHPGHRDRPAVHLPLLRLGRTVRSAGHLRGADRWPCWYDPNPR